MTFAIILVCGYHVYKDIWEAEPDNHEHHIYAVTIF